MHFKGTAHRYGRDIDTDVIIPARYLNSSEPEWLAQHCLEDLDADFVKKVKKGDVIVAEENFGCGSSREHAPIAIKAAGVDVVIAKSFARIFYRNSINTGLAIMECHDGRDFQGAAVPAVHSRDHRGRRAYQPHEEGAGEVKQKADAEEAAQGVDTSNLEAAQKKYDELKQPYDKLVEQRDAIRDEPAPL